MKHSPYTQEGARLRPEKAKAALLAFGLIIAVCMFAVQASAQEDFPWATHVDVDIPISSELHEIIKSGKGIIPDWANNIRGYAPNSVIFLHYARRNPFFTSDGKWIVFDDRIYGSWMVPVEGGEPQVAFDWYWDLEYELKGDIKRGTEGIFRTCGISPDGKEIIGVIRNIDFDKGTEFLYEEDGEFFTIVGQIPIIVAGNIETGEERIIADQAIRGRWSHDGRWFVYEKRNPDIINKSQDGMDFDFWEIMSDGVIVKEMSTGNEWRIADVATCPIFSADDASVILSMKDANGLWQIFSIPREGGAPRQLTFYGTEDTGRNARVSDVSPDGEWLIHTGDYNTGDETKTGLCVCSIVSGKSYPLFPEATNITTEGSWSPDGRKIVFSASFPLRFEDGTLRSGGPMWRIFTVDFDPLSYEKPAIVAENPSSGFAITGNYPNPFNPSTTIAFTLPEAGYTGLAIYNIAGQKVRELLSGYLPAGAQTAVWDGLDNFGNTVSAGVYVSRLQKNGTIATGRMLLVK